MKKIIKALLVMGAVFFVVPAYAGCAKNASETVSGAACSIKDLNNLEKNKNAQVKVMAPERDRDLRPINLNPEMKNSNRNCLFGMCLEKTLFGK